jgi:hypothetical protein
MPQLGRLNKMPALTGNVNSGETITKSSGHTGLLSLVTVFNIW